MEDNIRTMDGDGELRLTIMATLAQEESRKISERVRACLLYTSMEEKRLKQFTFYDLYYEALKGLPDEAAGRMAKNICRFMLTNEEVSEPQEDVYKRQNLG